MLEGKYIVSVRSRPGEWLSWILKAQDGDLRWHRGVCYVRTQSINSEVGRAIYNQSKALNQPHAKTNSEASVLYLPIAMLSLRCHLGERIVILP